MEAELLVGLKIPDATAITAFHALERMGYKLKAFERMDYYKFNFSGYFSNFSRKIAGVDVLVNANKHKAIVKRTDEKFSRENSNEIFVLVKDIGKNTGLLGTLRNRLGLREITDLVKGTLWKLVFPSEINADDARKTANEIAEKLLANVNYQEFSVF